ncbi:MAG: hypothetical protein P4L22_05695 [Candidatus Babeliales bacterium]|nr:hypothetical protein [Candidatus Babeliales bacterium]
MENNQNANSFLDSQEDKIILSYELLQLMEWLVENEAETMKRIIAKALKRGFYERLQESQNYKEHYSNDDMQANVLDFLGLLEVLLLEATNEQMVNNVLEKNSMPAIDHVDTTNCDINTVKTSIAIASSKVERNPKVNAQAVFLKELLKRWKPSKSTIAN